MPARTGDLSLPVCGLCHDRGEGGRRGRLRIPGQLPQISSTAGALFAGFCSVWAAKCAVTRLVVAPWGDGVDCGVGSWLTSRAFRFSREGRGAAAPKWWVKSILLGPCSTWIGCDSAPERPVAAVGRPDFGAGFDQGRVR
jgi:hypothetical protein